MINFDINSIKKLNLKRIMEEKNISPIQLSRLLKVTKPHISALLKDAGEKGSRNLGEKTIDKICKELKIFSQEFYLFNQEAAHSPPGSTFSEEATDRYESLIKKCVDIVNESAEDELSTIDLLEYLFKCIDAEIGRARALNREAGEKKEDNLPG